MMSGSPTGLAGLKAKYPKFKFRNRTGASRTFYLADGDSVQIQPGATCTVDSSLIVNLPPMANFEMIVPSIADLIDHDLITSSPPVVNDPTTAPSGTSITAKTTPTIDPESEDGGKPIKEVPKDIRSK